MPPRRTFSHDDILALAKEGNLDRAGIAERLDCSRQLVTQVVGRARKAGDPIPPLRRKPDPIPVRTIEERAERRSRPMISRAAVRVLKAEGKTHREIAKRLGCSTHTISDISKQLREADAVKAATSFQSLPGVPESAKSAVLADLQRRDMADIAAMLGLIPTADLRPGMEKAA